MIRASVEAAKVGRLVYILRLKRQLKTSYSLVVGTLLTSQELTASSLKFGLCLYFMAGLVSNFPEQQQQQAKYTNVGQVHGLAG